MIPLTQPQVSTVAAIFREAASEPIAELDRQPTTPNMPVAIRLALLAGALGIALAGVLAAASYWNASAPSTFAVLPIAEPYAVQAEAYIASGRANRRDLAAAESATHRELSLAPRRVDAHLRLAIIEVLRDGGLTVAALNDLDNSYRASALDPEYFSARIRFGLEHWGELDARTRILVSREIAVTSKYRPNARLRDLVGTVNNPEGRFGGLMSLNLGS